MLRPTNSLRAMPEQPRLTNSRTIRQSQLQDLYKLQARWTEFLIKRQHLKDLIVRNVKVENGTYSVTKRSTTRRTVHWKAEYIKVAGAARAKALIEKAVPQTTFVVWVTR